MKQRINFWNSVLKVLTLGMWDKKTGEVKDFRGNKFNFKDITKVKVLRNYKKQEDEATR